MVAAANWGGRVSASETSRALGPPEDRGRWRVRTAAGIRRAETDRVLQPPSDSEQRAEQNFQTLGDQPALLKKSF